MDKNSFVARRAIGRGAVFAGLLAVALLGAGLFFLSMEIKNDGLTAERTERSIGHPEAESSAKVSVPLDFPGTTRTPGSTSDPASIVVFTGRSRSDPDPPVWTPNAALPADGPGFPWPPPAPSTSDQISNDFFGSHATIGDVAKTITHALETTGYVERRYYLLPVPGLAVVTRLERIKDDGAPAPERWLAGERGETTLYDLLRGLFFTDPGHYRVIVFLVTESLPIRSPNEPTVEQARTWLRFGYDDVPDAADDAAYANGHTTAYIYDFVSDGRTFVLDRDPPPGRQQLMRAGVLTALETGHH